MCNLLRIVLFYHGANFVQKFGLDRQGDQTPLTTSDPGIGSVFPVNGSDPMGKRRKNRRIF
jgi:hypothetical protein